MIISGFPFISSGEGNSNEYKTIVLFESRQYTIGENVTLEIRFYEKDTLVDPDDLNMSTNYPPSGRYIDIDLETDRVSEGVYRVTFTITEEDLPWGGNAIDITVIGTKSDSRGESSDTYNFTLWLESPPGFIVEVTPDKAEFLPGETVRFSVVFTNNSEKVDPNGWYYNRTFINDKTIDVILVRDGVGEYHYDYIAPEDMESKDVGLLVMADYNSRTGSHTGWSYLMYYQIWLHTLDETRGDEEFLGEIGVVDKQGVAVSADVSIQYRYQNEEYENIKKTVTGQTNETGLLEIALNISGINEWSDIILEIWANGTGTRADDYHQWASADIWRNLEREAMGYGFEVLPKFFFFLPQDTNIKLEYEAYYDGTPLANTEMIYYFYFPSPWIGPNSGSDPRMGEILRQGSITTDENGTFSFDFQTPAFPTEVHSVFKYNDTGSRHGDGDWQEYGESFFIGGWYEDDESMGMTVKDFGAGQETTIEVTRSGTDGAVGKVGLIPVPTDATIADYFEALNHPQPEWRMLNPSIFNDKEAFEGDQFTEKIGVPKFFNNDYHFLIWGAMGFDSPQTRSIEFEFGQIMLTFLVLSIMGVIMYSSSSIGNPLAITSNAPSSMSSEEYRDVTATVRRNPPVEDADVTIEVEGSGSVDKSTAKTDENGNVTFTLTADNVTNEDSTITLWINASKEYYKNESYMMVITVQAYIPPKDMIITSNLPDTLESEQSFPFVVTVTGSPPIEGVYVTLATSGPGHTSETSDTTDENGQVMYTLIVDNVTGEDVTLTIYINGTKDGYNNAYYTKEITIKAWNEPVEDKEMIITTDLPDTLSSGAIRQLTVTVTGSPAIEGVFVTLQTHVPASTCKESDYSDANGQVMCVLTIENVTGENVEITVWINGTKDGYVDVFYEKVITIIAWNPPEPVKVLEPVEVDLGNNILAEVTAGVQGDVTLSVLAANQPDTGDPNALGVYLDVTTSGTGTLNWANITISYDAITAGIDPANLKMYYWNDAQGEWVLIATSGVDTVNKIVWANVTHLTIFAPRQEVVDTTPPVINHTPVTKVDEDTTLIIKAEITDSGNGVQSATLYYRKSGTSAYTTVGMSKNGDNYQAMIPKDVATTNGIDYYIEATDGSNTATHPADKTAPHQIKVEEEDSDSPGFGLIAALGALSLAGYLSRRKRS